MGWRWMEKINWTDRLKNDVLRTVKDEQSILHAVSRKWIKWICYILRRNCLFKGDVRGKTEETIEVRGIRG